MQPALFGPKTYTGEFATLNYQEGRGWVVTLWQFGRPTRYTCHEGIIPAVLEIVSAGAVWANEGMKQVFNEDVILATGG